MPRIAKSIIDQAPNDMTVSVASCRLTSISAKEEAMPLPVTSQPCQDIPHCQLPMQVMPLPRSIGTWALFSLPAISEDRERPALDLG